MSVNQSIRLTAWAALLLLIMGPVLAGIAVGSSAIFLIGALAAIALLVGRAANLMRAADFAALSELMARLTHRIEALATRRMAAPTPAAASPLPTAPARSLSHRLGDFVQSVTPTSTFAVAATLLTIAIPVLLHTYRLDQLQEEAYGDINTIFEYLDWIGDGLWPVSFVLSTGPLYHYMIYPVVALLGQHYASVKIASALIGLGTVFVTYLWARRLMNHGFALVVAFITGVSSWLLIFSRIGLLQILNPLIVMLVMWLLTRHVQTQSRPALIAAAAFASLGLYSYPQSMIIAPTFIITLVVLKIVGNNISWRSIGAFCAISILVAAPFVALLIDRPQEVISGYITDKVVGIDNPVTQFLTNTTNALLAFHIRGDSGFRSNPDSLPHLDPVSGILMLLGIVFWLERPRRRWFPMLALPFLMLQLPAILVLNFPAEVPSASRTLGVAPIAYLLAASGAWFLYTRLAARTALVARAALSALLAFVLVLNVQRYFIDYLDGLPYQNTAIAKPISRHIDSLPPDTNVYLYFCCWESGMPEPKSIHYELINQREINQLMPDGSLTCDTIDAVLKRPAVVFFDFRASVPDPALAACPQRLSVQTYVSTNGRPLYNLATLLPAPGSP